MSERLISVAFDHGPQIEIAPGASIRRILADNPAVREAIDFTPLGAIVNNEFVSVEYRIETDSKVRLVGYHDSYGQRVYRHTIAFLLAKVAHELFPGCDFAVEHSLSKGLYCSFRRDESADAIAPEELAAIEAGMQKLFDEKAPIDRVKITYDAAIAHFEAAGARDKLNLLRFKNNSKVTVYQCGDFMDLASHPLAANVADLVAFKLIPYKVGFVAMGISRDAPGTFPEFDPADHIYEVFKGHKEWGRIVRVRTVGDLNERIARKKIDDFIDVNEAYQEKRIALLAEQIAQRKGTVKWILIAGPSSSGKTTFSKRLSLQDWLLFSERCGQPGLHAATDAKQGSEQWNNLVAAVANFGREWGIVTDMATKVDTVSLANGGTPPYPALVERMDRAIAVLYRGSDLSTLSAGDGSVGASQQGEEADILEQDACEMLSETLQEQVERPFIRYVFGDEEPLAYVQVSPVSHPNLEMEMKIDQHLASLGVKLSKKQALERYPRTEPSEEAFLPTVMEVHSSLNP